MRVVVVVRIDSLSADPVKFMYWPSLKQIENMRERVQSVGTSFFNECIARVS